jgi:hypothetical protein
MLNARAIYRLLIEDEQPPTPDDPNQLTLSIDPGPDGYDPRSEILRYAEEPFRVPGDGPTSKYAQFSQQLGRRDSRKLAAHSYLVKYPDKLAVRYHTTDVATVYPDGRIVFDSGGWRPGGSNARAGWKTDAGTTTRDRMSYAFDSGWRIYKNDFVWYWYNHTTGAGCAGKDDKILPYDDGDTIYPDGSLKIQTHPIYPKRRQRRVA